MPNVSTKSTFALAETENVKIHIYNCFVVGDAIDIEYKGKNYTLLLDKGEAQRLADCLGDKMKDEKIVKK